MPSFLIIAVLCCTAIILLEYVMWRFYRQRMDGIYFPHNTDSSFFRFFTRPRMRFIAMFHAAILVAVVFSCIYFFW